MSEQQVAENPDTEVWPKGWYRFPLLPKLRIKQEDRWNTKGFYFNWMFLSAWSMDSVEFSIQLGIEEQIWLKIFIPYLIIHFHLPILPSCFLQRTLWRRPKRQVES